MLIGNKSKTAPSDRDLWATPWEIFHGVEKLFGRRFELDACASEHNAKCEDYITEEKNCLTCDWGYEDAFYKNIWINPPYSDPAPFIRKAIEEATRYPAFIVMLLPADTSVAWFKLCLDHAAQIWFITAENEKSGGRIGFLHNAYGKRQSGNSKGSMLVVFYQHWRSQTNRAVTHYISREQLINKGKEYV